MSGFLIWGAGGHGKVVADLVRIVGHDVVGFVDADEDKVGSVVEPGGGRVLMTDSALLSSLQAGHGLPSGADAVVVAIGNNAVRVRCLASLGDVASPPLVHPAATVSPSVSIGKGTVVLAGVVINASTTLGSAVIANTAAVVDHDCIIGDGVHLAPRSTLGGGVVVGDRCWVGAGATVIQQISIGAETMIGAGAVVIRNVPEGLTVVGVPARSIRLKDGT